jgi:hypothetical protein
MICTSQQILLGRHIKKYEMVGICRTCGDTIGAYWVLVEIPAGKRTRGRPL